MSRPVILCVGSGKGGVGKTTFTAHMGYTLARQGFSVGLVDADTTGGHLHLFLNMPRPDTGIARLLDTTETTVADLAVPATLQSTWFIGSGGHDCPIRTVNHTTLATFIGSLQHNDTDYILIDCGAGSDIPASHLYAMLKHGIIVVDGTPPSLDNAYGVLTRTLIRGLRQLFHDFPAAGTYLDTHFCGPAAQGHISIDDILTAMHRDCGVDPDTIRHWLYSKTVYLVINKCAHSSDERRSKKLAALAKTYLGLQCVYIGYVTESTFFRSVWNIESTPSMEASFSQRPSDIDTCYESITRNLVYLTGGDAT